MLSGTVTPGGTQGPDLAIHVRESFHGHSTHPRDKVARLQPETRRRPTPGYTTNYHVSTRLSHLGAEPGPRPGAGPPLQGEVREDRLQQVDGDEHVARHGLAGYRLRDLKRADAQQAAAPIDQRRPAERGVVRRGEDRPVEQVFPVARELPGATPRKPPAPTARSLSSSKSTPPHRGPVSPTDPAAGAGCPPGWTEPGAGRNPWRDRNPGSWPAPSFRRSR